ncbi:MAG: putative tellurite resistance protein B-like protein, partial [Phenylobacterium sp.]
RDDLPGLLLLPEPLLNADTIPVLATFAQWAKQQIDTQSGLVTMVDFWSALGQPAPQSIYKKDLELITKLCEIVGLGLAPDPRFHHAKPAVDGQLVLFMPSHGDDFSPSAKFNEVAMMLRLGAMMAGVDGTVDEQETTLLHRLIDNNPQLSAIEKSSLHAYLLWRLNAPVNMNGLKARLAPLCDTGKSAVSHVLVRIALADGTVDPNEVRQLEKLYAALGLDKTSVSSDIHRISAARPTAQSPTIEAKPQKANPTKAQPADSPITFNLDEDKLALHESETREVQSMLGAIFTDDEPLNEAPPIPTAPLTAQLDGKHQQFYQHLLGKDLWSRDELQSYCAQSGLMLDGAIETINDWAYDIIDDPVLEDEGDILVDQQTAQDIADELAAEVAA